MCSAALLCRLIPSDSLPTTLQPANQLPLAVIKYQHAVCYEAVYADIESGSPDVEQTWQDFGRLSQELDQAEIDVEELTNELAELYILHDSWIRIADTLLQIEEQRGQQ